MSSEIKFKEFLRQREGRVKMLVHAQNYIFFFRYQGDVFGGGEEARLTYAAMQDGGDDDLVFAANNLTKALLGTPQEQYFVPGDLDAIQVLRNKQAETELLMTRSNDEPTV